MPKLSKYNKKRDFRQTKEPRGEVKSSKVGLKFVIQKHQASQLHYDFRIEVDGVLKSWAVPKGLPNKSAERHLAMMVEDHPYDYRNFEGTIPEGNYGAGIVMIWDEGTYEYSHSSDKEEIQELVKKGLKEGELKLRLNGVKLNGLFAFVRFKKAGENAWLVIKDKDEFEGKKIENEDLSVRTGRTLDEITEDKEIKLKTKKNAQKKAIRTEVKEKVHKISKSESISPMLATLDTTPFSDPDWIFEVKWDGYRIISYIDDSVMLQSRKNQDYTKLFQPISDELRKIKESMVLDGEVVVVDKEGKSDFGALQEYKKTGEGTLMYYVFDILKYKNRDLTNLTLIERKELLKKYLPNLKLVKFSDHIEEKGKDFYKVAKEKKLEGIIAKKKDSIYKPGERSSDWKKFKLTGKEEVIITGYTNPSKSREGFGSLLMGIYKDGKLEYIGNTGSGFKEEDLTRLKKKLDKYKTKKSPFEDTPDVKNLATWLKPKIIAEVKFGGWTKKGYMRHAIFTGLSGNKIAKKIEVEKPDAKHDGYIKKEVELEISNPDKIYWPKEKYTKGNMINFYNDIADFILPYLKDRPQNMNRFPNGIKGKSFYQKDVDTVPEFVQIETIHSESNNRDLDYIVCNNKETLLYIANLGSIEINAWNSRIQDLEKPDYLIFDLDAQEKYFPEIIKTATEIRKLCEKLEIDTYVKTSGKRGIHVHIPLNAKYDFDQVRAFAEILSIKVRDQIPEIVSLERDPGSRKDKVYIDYLQNRRGQTTASVYSLRPVEGAPVSTPLKWSEVNKKLDPKKFNIKNTIKRLEKVGDLWEGVLGKGVEMEKVLGKLKDKS